MKLKAVLHKGCLPALVDTIHSPEFRDRILREVLVPHLHVPADWGPTQFYIQETDYAVGGKPMCVVNLSAVSLTESRSTQDFRDAAAALERVYGENIATHLEEGEVVELFVVIALDGVPFNMKSTLVESAPVLISRAGLVKRI